MDISNLSTNPVVVNVAFLGQDAGTFSGAVLLQPGAVVRADIYTVTNGGVTNGIFGDDGLHSYIGIVDAGGHQSCQESFSLITVGFEGFWWGLSMCVIPLVIWFARRGAAGGNPWHGDAP